jgi:NADH:ubiquinone oxidoreductase subunit 4 (subunit M)
VVPLHGWLPAILAGTATPVSILVAGAGLNAGVYGLIRVAVGVLPDGARWAATTVVALGALSVAYGAVRALFEEDLKRLLAYATISQMGFCLVGIGAMTREGIAAAIIQMVSHGIIASMLFILGGGLATLRGSAVLSSTSRSSPRSPVSRSWHHSGSPDFPDSGARRWPSWGYFPRTASLRPSWPWL